MEQEAFFARINKLGKNRSPFFFVYGYDKGFNRLWEFPFNTHEFEFQFSTFSNSQIINHFDKQYFWQKQPISYAQYLMGFEKVMYNLKYGNSFLVNYTCPTLIKTNLSLNDIYTYSTAPYKLYVKRRFVVFSPERFVLIYNGKITTCPMKGTIDAALPNAEAIILGDPKEMAEHATIVDLLRNDLSMVATNVEVARYRYTETVQTNEKQLIQVSSEITGQLPDNYIENLGNILQKLLPAGSICGAPKPKTLKIIKDAENYQRGFYSGVCGYFNGECLDSAVMIRYIEQTPERMVFKSGGGITINSDPLKEYNEMIDKVYVPFI
jgi:para-aminobenzoate synthetase component I